MALANNISDLCNKLARRLGLLPLLHRLPEEYNKDAWAKVIMEDTMQTFSRYFPRKVRFVVNDETCHKITEHGKRKYIIKDEYLKGIKLLGVIDIDWQDMSMDNISLNQIGGTGYYVPSYAGLEDTFLGIMGLQIAADSSSLYNNNIIVDFEYPNKISLSRAGNVDVDLTSYVVNLIVEHSDLTTISPTKMETFEALAQADVANFLAENLKYYDGLETIFLNIDLKLSKLEEEANKRDNIIEDIKNSYVSTANDNIPYIMTISG